MKPIIINDANKEKISNLLDECQKRCSVRTVTLEEIFDAGNKIQELYGISKKSLEGCKFRVDMNAQRFPGAYKWVPESTIISVIMQGGKWRLNYISRGRTAIQNVQATLTDEAKQAIIDKHTWIDF